MKISDLPEWIKAEFEFPLMRATVIDRAGTLEIDAPDRADSETLSTILNRSGDERYQSQDGLLDAIRGNLSDEYIGRKYYDDRGMNPSGSENDAPKDTADESI